jgi:hypothetical protein
LGRSRSLLSVTLAVAFALSIGGATSARPAGAPRSAVDLPASLTDNEFWDLSESLSEPNGIFQSDNLLSNELVFGRIVPELIARTKPGGAYLGVGPEQNFTYIAAIRPRMAFITDIRRGNLHMQLMYKALFELSTDRAEFVSRLFTKKRPAGLTTTASATELMDAYWEVPTESEQVFDANLQAIQQHLTKTHGLPLSAEDLDGIARVYRTFYWYGPSMTYSASTQLNRPAASMGGTTYRDLMVQGGASGQGLSYLGAEDRFLFLKELERKNLVVPVVGNFSGPKALRAVGAYLRAHDATVTAFYLSNVETYLRRDGSWPAFCANVATFPLDDASVFIRPNFMGAGTGGTIRFITFPGTTGANVRTVTINPPAAIVPPGPGPSASSGLVPIAEEVKGCSAPGLRLQ